jgi:lipoprotein-releasing system ATP-binding protein
MTGADMAPVLETRGLTRILPGKVPVTLVRDVTLSFEAGAFVAITGPSGSGKSSLLYLLGLLDRPTAGQVLIGGRDTAALDAEERARLRLATIGFVFQFHFLLPEFTVRENVLIPMRRLGALDERAMRDRTAAILESLGLADEADRRPEQLSGGQRQRAAIARALANDPPILLADEPTGNLDTRNGAIVFDVFARLARDQRRTVITVTHDVDLGARTNRRVRLVDARVVEDSAAAAVFQTL